MVMVKVCPQCKIEKDTSEFHRSSQHKDGLSQNCKDCNKARSATYRNSVHGKMMISLWNKKWCKTAAGKECHRRNHLRLEYGMTLAQYDDMFQKQNGVCAICGKPETACVKGTQSSLSTDHDHVTGKVRGLLCGVCNKNIGVLENLEFMTKAQTYLRGTNE